jgi:phosphoribosylamine--glycine ligase
MGSFSPVPGITSKFLDGIVESCIAPVLEELKKRGIDYRGFLYCGLMLTPDGPKVLEYNVRFGDPEAQSVLPRLSCNFAQFLKEAAEGQIKSELSFSDDAVVTVVIATRGYAETNQQTGDVITGIEDAQNLEGVSVYCAGTGENDQGELITDGGRVLSVVGRGKDHTEAGQKAYGGVKKISWKGCQYRTDIRPAA